MPGIYLRHGDTYVPMTEQPYERESVLQALIAQHPEMLAGEDRGRPALLMVKREAPVRPEQDSALSLDQLYLDANGVPTLVEVKQGANRQVRREVVGQMLDYAAHASGSFSVGKMQEWLEDVAKLSGTTTDALLAETLGIEDPDVYWNAVATNLDAEQFRLVFVSDQIPPGLRRIIEFLNEHTNIDVLGIEVSQYTDSTGSQQIIVPRFVGETEAARQTKRTRSRRASIDRDELLASFESGSEDVAAVSALLDWATESPDLDVWWNRAGNITPADRHVMLLRLWPKGGRSTGELEVRLATLRDIGGDAWDAGRLDQLIRRLEANADLRFDPDRRWPAAPIAPLADPRKRQAFLDVVEEVVHGLNPPG